MTFFKNRIYILESLMALLVLVSAWYLFSNRVQQTSAGAVGGFGAGGAQDVRVVVIDAGHGGNDPGKIGVDGTLEKDLNLVIAGRVKKLLEQQDVKVIMTREKDEGLYDDSSGNKKVEDMKRRCSLMNEEEPDCVISIHQNSYHQEQIWGAQMFYYHTSKEGKRLAEILQEEFGRVVNPENQRKAKANDSYYLLKKTVPPICIVECGFLSNWEESKLLKDPTYQERIAWAIHLGVLKYLNGRQV